MAFDRDTVLGEQRQAAIKDALTECVSCIKQIIRAPSMPLAINTDPMNLVSGQKSDGTSSPSTTGSNTPCVSYHNEPAPIPDRFIAPSNYGQVVPGLIHRSSFPKPENFSFLRTLKLKTILTLVDEPFPAEFYDFVADEGINHFKVPLPANKETVRMSQCKMTEALRIVLDRANFPLLIHCNRGKHRTGCVVASFRKSQGKDMDRILDEYHAHADPKARKMDEVFIESFDERTVLCLSRQNAWRTDAVGSIDGPLYHSPFLPAHSSL